MTWDPSNFRGVDLVHMYVDEIWTPKILLSNSWVRMSRNNSRCPFKSNIWWTSWQKCKSWSHQMLRSSKCWHVMIVLFYYIVSVSPFFKRRSFSFSLRWRIFHTDYCHTYFNIIKYSFDSHESSFLLPGEKQQQLVSSSDPYLDSLILWPVVVK